MTNCLMCNDQNIGWFEVLGNNCGHPPEQIKEILCDVHLDIFREQLTEVMEKDKND